MAISKEQPLRPYVQALGDAIESGDIIHDGTVTTAKLADGAVTLAKLDSTLAASIPMSPLTDAEIDAITEA